MTPRYEWRDDPACYRLDPDTPTVPNDPGDEPVLIRDAYAQWVLGWGKAFLPAAQLATETGQTPPDPDDFDFVLVERPAGPNAAAGDAAPTPGPALADHRRRRASGLRFVSADAPGTPDVSARPPRGTLQVVSPLPVRASAVPRSHAPGSPAITADTTLDPGRLVITAVIDDAINVFNRRFAVGARSRVDFAWIMDADAEPGGHVPLGREMTGAQIGAALASGRSETALMRDHGLIGPAGDPYRPSALRAGASHGTAVADLAAGYDPRHPDAALFAAHSRLIAVQLPALAVADTSAATLIASLILAVRYVYERAAALSIAYGAALPVALNLSFGFGGGPKNGQHPVERALREAADGYRRALTARNVPGAQTCGMIQTLPAGNDHLRQGHAVGENGRLDIGLRLRPDDRTASFVEIWLPRRATRATVRLTPPGGPALDPGLTFALDGDPPTARLLHLAGGVAAPPVARVSIDQPLTEGGGDDPWHRLLIAFAPTRIADRARPAAPFGRWRLEASCDAAGHLHAWIPRDQDISALPMNSGQAVFDDDGYTLRRYDTYGDLVISDSVPPGTAIRRDGTISGFATRPAAHPHDPKVSVTGFVGDGQRIAHYAAAGFARSAGQDEEQGGAQEPDLAARCERSRVLPGVLTSGTLTGTVRRMNGTSAAAPQVARTWAEAWQSHTDPRLGERPAIVAQELRNKPGIRLARLTQTGGLVDTPGTRPAPMPPTA